MCDDVESCEDEKILAESGISELIAAEAGIFFFYIFSLLYKS